MGKLFGLILGVAVLAFVAFKAMYGHTSVDKATPKEQLDSAKSAAKRIEAIQDKAAQEALEKAEVKD